MIPPFVELKQSTLLVPQNSQFLREDISRNRGKSITTIKDEIKKCNQTI